MGTLFSIWGSFLFIEGDGTTCSNAGTEGVMFGMRGKEKARLCRTGEWRMIPMKAKGGCQSPKGIPALNICHLCVGAGLAPFPEWWSGIILSVVMEICSYGLLVSLTCSGNSCKLILNTGTSWSCLYIECFCVICLRNICAILPPPWTFFQGLQLCLCTFLSLRLETVRR